MAQARLLRGRCRNGADLRSGRVNRRQDGNGNVELLEDLVRPAPLAQVEKHRLGGIRWLRGGCPREPVPEPVVDHEKAGDGLWTMGAMPEESRDREDERSRVPGDVVQAVAEPVDHVETFGEAARVEVRPGVDLLARGVQKDATLALARGGHAGNLARLDVRVPHCGADALTEEPPELARVEIELLDEGHARVRGDAVAPRLAVHGQAPSGGVEDDALAAACTGVDGEQSVRLRHGGEATGRRSRCAASTAGNETVVGEGTISPTRATAGRLE